MAKTKRGYSRDFTPHGDTGKKYTLDAIPAGLWSAVRAKAKREGISLRALILGFLTRWLESEPHTVIDPATDRAEAAEYWRKRNALKGGPDAAAD